MTLLQRVEAARRRAEAQAAAEAAAAGIPPAGEGAPSGAGAAGIPVMDPDATRSSSGSAFDAAALDARSGGSGGTATLVAPPPVVAPAASRTNLPAVTTTAAIPAEPAGITAAPRTPATTPATPVRTAAAGRTRDEMIREIRMLLQAEVVKAFDTLLDVNATDVRPKVEAIVDRTVAQHGFAVTRDERAQLVDELANDVTGFGPLEPFLADESITEVMVNGPRHVYIERHGKIERVDSVFLNDEHVLRIIDRIITPMGRRIDETSPRVDARLPDGSRVNAIVEPLSLVGPVITVRKFAQTPYTVDDLVRFGTASAEMFDFLQACIEARLNVFVSGGTGSGKTTTLNVISAFIPNDERIVTIEDAAELQLRQDHVITLESRPPNLEGEGEITIRQLLRNAMHMRPDRVIVGECRAGEALDMLQAMTTGHDGSLSTGHANSPADMLRRLETMVLMTGYALPLRAFREQIASAVDLIVHTARLKDGSRKITHITEVFGIEDDEILTQDIFAFEQTAIVDGKIQGELRPTGIRPTFMPQFEKNGVRLPEDEFGIPPEDPDKPTRPVKGRLSMGDAAQIIDEKAMRLGLGKAVVAGGMVYVTSVGPVDPATNNLSGTSIKDHARQCLQNLATKLEESGSSLDKVVWANWSLRDATEFEAFNEEWVKWFPGEAPVGQGTLMPPLQRRAGFRVSLGVIAQA
ncbi:MAG TPA: ATPase, T2SS/T4P/T4SS family [Candidatus Limnocylindrales bacterium]|nr:ATPase, T2SS/T4P/T4SS family [Candidatus Limnocylindrales bacterium]